VCSVQNVQDVGVCQRALPLVYVGDDHSESTLAEAGKYGDRLAVPFGWFG
jgi:hypothetical protein